MKQQTIAILGAGSWGTAIAIHLAQAGHRVFLWGHNPEHMATMASLHENPYYLPNCQFPNTIIPNADLEESIHVAHQVIIAVPSHAFKALLNQLPQPKQGLAWLTKGVDPQSHCLLSELVTDRFGPTFPKAIISGPSFAKEVAKSLPTAITVASDNPEYQQSIHALLHHHHMRVYLTNDLIGVQVCGAVKNVLAIACGISDGLGYGANAKAALITRGLAEMSRLGLSLGAEPETFLGLAGVGDLVLTCTDDQSRNRRFGLLLGQGLDIIQAEKTIGQVVEGKHNAAQICEIARKHHVEMPICGQVNALLENKLTPEQAVKNLMNRPARDE